MAQSFEGRSLNTIPDGLEETLVVCSDVPIFGERYGDEHLCLRLRKPRLEIDCVTFVERRSFGHGHNELAFGKGAVL